MDLFLGEKLSGVKGYEGLYAVTTFGRVWSYPKSGRKGEWFGLNRKTRYIRLGLIKDGIRKWYPLHRLVAIAFIANPMQKKQVNHKDGDRYNCSVNNLEWMTARENIQHAVDTGLNTNLKLSFSQKQEICRYRYSGTSARNLSVMYGVNVNSIYKILRNYMPEYVPPLDMAA